MSIFSVLNVANRGLVASQMGLDLTSQNIANADTEGYSRKRLNLAADYRLDSSFGQMGTGVEVVTITRMRNTGIDGQIQRQNHQLGYYTEMDSSLESIENIFNEPSTTGISSYMSQFFDSWNNLTNNPSSLAARTNVKTSAQTLASVFHNTSLQLDKMQETKNNNLASTVDEINKIGSDIYNLNREIASVELGGQNANDSRDRRDVLMKKLSTLIEFEEVDSGNGQKTLSVGGNIFVSGVSFNALEVYSGDKIQNSTSYLQYGVKMKGVNHPLQINAGQLKAIMDIRDITVPSFRKTLDDLAVALAKSVNDQHKQGYNLSGFSGFDFFDPTTTGAQNFAISAAVSTNVANIAAARGGSQSAAVTNNIAAGTANYGQPPVQLTKTALPTDSATNLVNGSVTVKLSTGIALTEGTDYSIDYIRGTIQLLNTTYNNKALTVDLSFTTGNFPGPGNNENAVKIASLRTALSMAPDRLNNNTSSFNDFYSGLVGDVGLARTEASSNKQTRNYLVQQYTQSQESVAGVSLDEEMSNLIKYQHTYQAAAKIVSTAQQMLEILMNL